MSKKYKKLKRMILSTIAMSSAFTIFGCTSEKTQEVVNMDKNNTYVENTISEKLAESGTVESSTEVSTNVLEEVDSNVNYDRGESKGEVIINKVEESETIAEATEGQGGDKSLVDELQQAENKEDLPWDLQMEQNGGEYVSSTADQYFVKSADGSYEFTPEFIAIVQESAFGKGATIEQITDYFNENSGLLVDLEFDYLEGFIELLEAMGSYKTLVPQSSTSTTTANNNQTTTPSTSGNTSSSGGSTSSTGSTASTGGSTGSSTGSTSSSGGSTSSWIPDDQLPPRDVPKGSTGGVARDGRGDGSGTGPLTSNYDIGNLMQ